MGAGKAAVEILHRRATPEERAAFEADYAERLLNPYVAAERGLVDAVIDPADTRREIARRARRCSATKRERSSAASTTTRRSDGRPGPCTVRRPTRYARTDYRSKGTTWPTPSRSPTTAPASRSRSRSSTAVSTPPSWRELVPGALVLRPGVHDDGGVHVERDHRARRRRRHPALPRLPDRAAGRAVDLPRGRLPAAPRRAARPPSSSTPWTHDITYHTFIHENVRKRFMEGFHYDAHPMGMLVSRHRRAVDLLPRRQGHPRPGQPRQADPPAHRQDADARGRAATASGRACRSSTRTTRSASPRTSSR